MKSFKQVLALVVVACMMLSVPAFAAVVPTDVVGTAYESSVTLLANLGIMIGDEKGAFNAEATVKRSEMAKIVVLMVGSQSAAASAAGTAVFTDVPTSHWACGFVNVANSLGIVKGVGDNKFDPDADVTYAQALTMIMRALGYEPAALENGGFPNGYIVLANDTDVTEDVDTPSATAATRGNIAKLIANAVEAPMMRQVGYGTDKRFSKTGSDGTKVETVLINKLKLDWYKGQVKTVNVKDKTVEFANVKTSIYSNVDSEDAVEKTDGKSIFDYLDGVTFGSSVIGSDVDFYVNSNDKIVAYKLPKKVETFYSSIKTFNDDSDTTRDSTASYTLNGAVGSDAIKSITFNNGQKYSVTYSAAEGSSIEVDLCPKDTEPLTDDNEKLAVSANLYNYRNYIGKVTVTDGELTKIYLYEFEPTKGLVTEATDSVIKYTTDGNTTNVNTINKLNVAESISVILDGQLKSIKDIKPGMYIEYSKYKADNADEYTYIMGVSGQTVSGSVTKASSEEFYIGTTKLKAADVGSYYVSTNGGKTYTAKTGDFTVSLDSLLQEKTDVVTNLVGKALFIKGSTTKVDFYGIAYEGYASSGDDYVSVYTAASNGAFEKKSYAIDDSDFTAVKTAADVSITSDVKNVAFTTLNNTNDSTAVSACVYKFTLNSDGKLSDIVRPTITQTVGATTSTEAISAQYPILTYKLNSDYNQISIRSAAGTKQYDVNSDVVFADTKSNFEDHGDSTLPKVVAWDNIKGKDLNHSFKLDVVIDLDDVQKAAMVIMDNGTSGLVSDNLKMGYVTDKFAVNSDDVQLTMYNGMNEVNKTVDKDDASAIGVDYAVIYEDVGDAGLDLIANGTTPVYFKLGKTPANWQTSYDAANQIIPTKTYNTGDTSFVANVITAPKNFTESNTIITASSVAQGDTKYKVSTDAFVMSYDVDKDEFVSDDVTSISAGDTVWYILDTDAEVVLGVVFYKN